MWQKSKALLKTVWVKRLGDTLLGLADVLEITAARHGVDHLEIANELYHIVFGAINEELAARGIVAVSQLIPGEGRRYKCIELYV